MRFGMATFGFNSPSSSLSPQPGISDDAWDDIEFDDNASIPCNVIYSHRKKLILGGKFEGIPENLIINCIAGVVLLCLFTCLRKKAWDYGRIALVHRIEQRWTQLFYGDGSATHLETDEESSVAAADRALHQDKGAFSWIKAMFTLKDKDIYERNGEDAIQYLSFQRHIIVYLIIVCIISIAIILPMNYSGDLMDKNLFGKTTLTNLDPGSERLWIHIFMSCLYAFIGILVLKHFAAHQKLDIKDSVVNRTLMIRRIPKNTCDRSRLLEYFREEHANCAITDIQFAYDVKELIKLEKERETAFRAKIYCESSLKDKGERVMMHPSHCGRICICPRCKQVDAFEYYSVRAEKLSLEVERARSISLGRPLGIAFVTFKSENMAQSVYKAYQKSYACGTSKPLSVSSRELKPSKWVVNFAPAPEDIFWENLAVRTRFWYIRAISINLALFLLFFLCTTPTIILNYFEMVNPIIPKQFVRESPIISEFLSTLVLLIISVLLPVVVRFAVNYLSLWTRSDRNYTIMLRTYIFLLFMVVILPLLQLTSVRAFTEWIFQQGGQSYRWQCVFMSGNGAFFVNYVITASFCGTVLELIRFSELFMYVICVLYSRSPAEQAGPRNAVLWEFEFGVQYAWFLLIFSVVIIYSLVCPLIVPFGVVYMFAKHYIDRHNIYFVYGRSKINKNIHATAVHFVMAALILMQLCLFCFLLLRNGWTAMSTMSLAISIITLMVFMTQMSLHCLKRLNPLIYKNSAVAQHVPASELVEDISPTSGEQPCEVYLPMVLKQSCPAIDMFITNPQERSYGTNEDSIETTPNTDDCQVLTEAECGVSEEPYQRF